MACGVLVDRFSFSLSVCCCVFWLTVDIWVCCCGNNSWSHSRPVTSADPSLSDLPASELPLSSSSPSRADKLPPLALPSSSPDPALAADAASAAEMIASKCAAPMGESTSTPLSPPSSSKKRCISGVVSSKNGRASITGCPSVPVMLIVGEGLKWCKGGGEGDCNCTMGWEDDAEAADGEGSWEFPVDERC